MPLTIQLKGWKQVLVGLLVLVSIPIGYTKYLQRGLEDKLPTLIYERLKMDLGSEVFRNAVPSGQKPETVTRQQGEQIEKEFKALESLKVTSIEKRGWGAKLVVRVKYNVGDSAEETRYYKLKHGWLTGWMVSWKTTELAYRTGWL